MDAIPVTILTGFLGAGKTTLLKRLLDDPQGVRFGVLVNDFGAINIDAALIVEADGAEVALQNGCVCCTIRDDLVEAVEALLRRDPVPDRILVEASGVSQPLPIADTLEAPSLAGRVGLDGIFCLVDAANFRGLDFAATELALDQALGSDMVLLNKVDLAEETTLAAIEDTLRGPMPRLRILRTREAAVPREILFGAALPRADRVAPAAARDRGGHDHAHHDHDQDQDHTHGHDHVHDHGSEFASWHWERAEPVDVTRLRRALKGLPEGVMRAKGVFRDVEGRRLVFQQVGRRAQLSLDKGPAPDRSALVVIGRHRACDPATLGASLDGCLATAADEPAA